MEEDDAVPGDDVEIDVGVGEQEGGVDVVEETRFDVFRVDEAVSGEGAGSAFTMHDDDDDDLFRPATHLSHNPSNALEGNSCTVAAITLSSSSSSSTRAQSPGNISPTPHTRTNRNNRRTHPR